MLKIALSGKLQSGKTSVAVYLGKVYDAYRVSFAATLKERMVAAGVNRDDVYKRKPPLVRELLQVYGQVMRQQDEDYWVKAMMQAAALLEEQTNAELLVCDDMRFRNEAQHLREDGWKLVRIERIGGPDPGRAGEDISEIDLDDWEDWDAVIEAEDGDLMDLFQQIGDFISKCEV